MTSGSRPVALVSGGSRGIGAAVVLRLARDGYDVAFCYRSQAESAKAVAAQATELGVRALAFPADVTDPEAAKAFVRSAEAGLGPVEAVVSCAGITRDKGLAMMSDEDWTAVLRTNLDGTFHLCRAAVFPMLKRRSGSIVMISSVAGVQGNAGQTNYSAAKAGIIGFSKALAQEAGPFGVRVNAVTPGFIATDMTDSVTGRQREKTLSRIPLGRWGEAGEVAELVAFLTSPRSGYITGGVFPIDGGIRL